uniref:Glutamyl-tRNA reductase n=1 Tax=Coccolithus braarudii TaxID=221442 RepID=A0A7S0LNA0_9EUKA
MLRFIEFIGAILRSPWSTLCRMCPFMLLVYLLGMVQLARGASYVVGQHLPALSRPAGYVARSAARICAPTAQYSRSSSISCVATRPEQVVGDALKVAEAAAAAAVVDGAGDCPPTASTAPAAKKKGGGKGGKEGQKKARGAVVHGKPMVIGLSHKTATVDVREKLSIKEAEWNEAAAALCEFDSIQEAAVLSTCNRFELYLAATDQFAATRDALEFLRGRSGLTDLELRPNLFMLQNDDAVSHLLRVSAGLDSLVIGEGQILSQVKACYSHAIFSGDDESDEPVGSAGKVLGRLLNLAVMSGKFVRSETQIAKGAVSISSAAVELAILKCPPDLAKPLAEARVTIIGAGKMSKLLMTHLASHGVTKLTLLNRSPERAHVLAADYPDVDVRVGLMDELWPVMEESDLVFTSTSATGCILTRDLLQERVWGQDGGQKLAVIDISVPRNVESECNEVEQVCAYNVDDLKQVVAKNQARRRHKVLEAEALLRVEEAKFSAWQESLQYVPAISDMQGKFEQVRAAELAKAMKKLKGLSDKEKQAVEVVTKGIINKLMHGPMTYLRSEDSDGSKASVSQIRELFKLD